MLNFLATDQTPDARALAAKEAAIMYEFLVSSTGFDPPTTFAELLLFVEMAGGQVMYHPDTPAAWRGAQIGEWIHVADQPRMGDRDRMRVLAHEWCHDFRRHEIKPMMARLYPTRAGVTTDYEEMVAEAFEKMF